MKSIRPHKTAAKAAELRSTIKRVWLAHAQAYPFEVVTVSQLQQLMPTQVHRNTILKHMDAIRLEALVKRTIKGVSRDAASDRGRGESAVASIAADSARDGSPEIGR
jgi:hypothetical protein